MAVLFMFVAVTECDNKGHQEMGNTLMKHLGEKIWDKEDGSTLSSVDSVEMIYNYMRNFLLPELYDEVSKAKMGRDLLVKEVSDLED